jgi:hypothetical protein
MRYTLHSTLLAAVLLLTSCANLQNVDWEKVAATVAGTSVEIGASLDLADNPGHRPLYAAAKGALDKIVNDGTFDPVEFQKALRLLPVAAFHGETGALLTGLIVQVYDSATSELIIVESDRALGKVIVAVRDGLQRALTKAVVQTKAIKPGVKQVPRKMVVKSTQII